MIGVPSLTAAAADGPNVAAGRTAAASATAAANAKKVTDGDQSTFWEGSGKGAQWVQSDLGAAKRIDEVTLKLPADWKSRKQTLALQGSEDGTSFSTLKSSASYTFSEGAGNKVTIAFPAAKARYVRADITANSAGKKAQLSELEVRTAAAASLNLAAGRTLTASSFTDVYPAPRANDGNKSTYWESSGNAFPQWIQADLGSSVGVNSVVLKLPDGWGARDETLKIQGRPTGPPSPM